ncbi:hypothetical protein BDR03DRAFT_981451 [Suillus americanus]|nr:hypothetical protein BDR03DRAFT_981451 [Suillus americanus]
MPPKVGASRSTKNATNIKHTKITRKCPSHKNTKAIKKPRKHIGLNPSLNSDTSQIGIHAQQPQPPASYRELLSLIDSEGMDEDSEEDKEDEIEEDFRQPGPSLDLQQVQQLGQPGLSHDYYHHQRFRQPSPPLGPQQFQQPDLQQDFQQPQYPSLSLDYQQFQQPDPGQDYQQFCHPTLQQGYQQFQWPPQPAPYPYPAHTYGLLQAPLAFVLPELESHEAQQFNVPTPTMFRNIERMQERHREQEQAHYSGQLPIDLPGICKVSVYEPCCPPKGHRGQLFPTGVIRATGDTIVTAPLPSQRDLPPISTTPSPITDSARSHPYAR